MNDDLISRQAAIDEICLDWCSRQYDDCVHISDFKLGCYWCDGCSDVQTIMDLPSAQPEIVRCKDCKWKQGSECVRFADVRPFPDDFCSRAERRKE